MEDSHFNPHPCVGSVPVESDCPCWGQPSHRP